jgi:threonine synthase
MSAAAGLEAVVLVPHDLEASKILGTTVYGARVVAIRGTYDEVNRLCSEIAGKLGWAFANVNLRPYYSEGSKTVAYEAVEQLGWEAPDAFVAPMAGGSLVTKIGKALHELDELGLAPGASRARVHGAQATGCAPIVDAVVNARDALRPVKKPTGIARSLAIGDPADGWYAKQTIEKSGGWAAAVGDDEIVAGMRLLAETCGIFTETAGGVTVAAAKRLVAEGKIGAGERVVLCVTGQGLKTTDPLVGVLPAPPLIAPKLTEFEELLRWSSGGTREERSDERRAAGSPEQQKE